MSGIAGISMRSGKHLPLEILQGMNAALYHRGPDSDGTYANDHMGITHSRHGIIDENGGKQPISDDEKRIHIAVNGEIYNYVPLRQKLEGEGFTFRTVSDSEIPLQIYKKLGMDFVNMLAGMYAIAILDEHTGDIILARDPVGIKPLYICETQKGVAFASEPSALTRSGWQKAELNADALPCFLNRQFVIGTETLFENIYRVKPGEVIRIHAGEIVERRMVPLDLRAASHMEMQNALESFDALLSEKIQSHMQAEVPYGAFLSGGIDSSSVVSRMSELTSTVRTYTVGFEHVSVADERAMAENLSQQLGTEHRTVEFGEADFWHYLPSLCSALDDLVADYAALPTLKLAETAHEDVKIILSGEGGDEIFAGYGRYRRQSWWRRLMRRPFRGGGDARRFGGMFQHPKDFTEWYKRELPDKYYHKRGFTKLQMYQAEDIAEWLPNDLLIKLDRCLMAYSIEGRVPLLDREMVSFVFSLPDKLKIRGKKGKWLLKEWLHRRHPEMNVWAPKRGFTVPLHEWLERKREKLADWLPDHPALADIIVPDKLRAMLMQPLNAKGAKLIFNMLCLSLWYDIHILGKPVKDIEW